MDVLINLVIVYFIYNFFGQWLLLILCWQLTNVSVAHSFFLNFQLSTVHLYLDVPHILKNHHDPRNEHIILSLRFAFLLFHVEMNGTEIYPITKPNMEVFSHSPLSLQIQVMINFLSFTTCVHFKLLSSSSSSTLLAPLLP